MGYGRNANISRMNYDDCVKALASARNKDNGKPIGTIRIFNRHDHYAVQQYSTDIVRYYPDGSFAVCTEWTSNSTINAIGSLTGKWVSNRLLPTFNGRKSDTIKHHQVDGVIFKGVNGYIRFDKDGVVDKSTVASIDVEIITNSKAALPLRRRATFLAEQVLLRRKLGVKSEPWVSTHSWLQRNLHRDDFSVDYRAAPETLELKSVEPFWYAKQAGATKTIQFKEFP